MTLYVAGLRYIPLNVALNASHKTIPNGKIILESGIGKDVDEIPALNYHFGTRTKLN
jgi:hypothetical protein